MAYLAPVLLFVAPFLLYALLLRVSPREAPRTHVLLLALAGLLLALGSAVIYGLSRGAPPGAHYVPPHLENGRVVPAETRP